MNLEKLFDEYFQELEIENINNNIDNLINKVKSLIGIFFEIYPPNLNNTEIGEISPDYPIIYTEKKSWKQIFRDTIGRIIRRIFHKDNIGDIIDVSIGEEGNKFKQSLNIANPESKEARFQIEDKSILQLREKKLDDFNLYNEIDDKISRSAKQNKLHPRKYKILSYDESSTLLPKAYSGQINDTQFLVNDQETSDGSITIIKMDNKYFGFKVIDGKIVEYIEEMRIRDKYAYRLYDGELYMNNARDGKSNSIVYYENTGGDSKICFFDEEQENGKFLVKIKAKYKSDSNDGTYSCELLFSSKDEFLEKKEPIEISLYDKYERRRMVKTEDGSYELFMSRKIFNWDKVSTEWSEEIKENYNLNMQYIFSMILLISPIMESETLTLTIDDFDKRCVNAIKFGMESIPKKVLDVIHQLHPELKIDNNDSNEKKSNYYGKWDGSLFQER